MQVTHTQSKEMQTNFASQIWTYTLAWFCLLLHCTIIPNEAQNYNSRVHVCIWLTLTQTHTQKQRSKSQGYC